MRFVLAVALDIDHTMRNWRDDATIEEMEWNGHIDYWKNLCELLINICKECDVKIYFGIATAKEFVDGLVKEAVICLQKYLVILEENQERLLVNNANWAVNFDGVHYDYDYSSNKFTQTNKPSCVYVTNGKSKVNALEKMREHYGIRTRSSVIMFDNSPAVGEDVMRDGFSFVSAENINAGENTAEQRDIETIKAMSDLLKEVVSQLVELKVNYLNKLLLKNSTMLAIKEFCYSHVPTATSLNDEKGKVSLIEWIVNHDIELLRRLIEKRVFTLTEIRKLVPDCKYQIAEIFDDYPHTKSNSVKDSFLFFTASSMGSDTESTSDSVEQGMGSDFFEMMPERRNSLY